MPRYFIDIEYDGAGFSGWQTQENTPETIQEYVNRALSTVLRSPIECLGAGRTDAGVHALKLPAHFDWDGELHTSFQVAMNALLPEKIAVRAVYQAVDPEMNARFAATQRQYKYQLVQDKRPTLRHSAWNCRCRPDFGLLQTSAAIFLEYEDFASFCKSNANNKTNFCKITESRWEQLDDRWVYWVSADRFLRGMVRGLVGTMMEIARGRMELEELHKILQAKDRRSAGPSAPAEGLFLTDVQYPAGSLIPLAMRT